MYRWNGGCKQTMWHGLSHARVGREPCYTIGQIRQVVADSPFAHSALHPADAQGRWTIEPRLWLAYIYISHAITKYE